MCVCLLGCLFVYLSCSGVLRFVMFSSVCFLCCIAVCGFDLYRFISFCVLLVGLFVCLLRLFVCLLVCLFVWIGRRLCIRLFCLVLACLFGCSSVRAELFGAVVCWVALSCFVCLRALVLC